MGNSLGCSSSGERLLTAVRDGDAVEVSKLLKRNPWLVKYCGFAGLTPPLHLAAAKGNAQIVALLLENGADVNLKNLCGQTPLMQACRYGHWEVVQNLMLFRCNVFKVEYVSGKTALHFAAAGGHIRCIRLLAADFEFGISNGTADSAKDGKESQKLNYEKSRLSKFVNKADNSGTTALHLAASSGNSDCVHLLLDLNADVSALTVYHTCATTSIGGGSTPLHLAAYSGNLRCCQVLLARGASRSVMNYNGWLPVDVAKVRGCNWLVPVLSLDSGIVIPFLAPSNYLSFPLRSVLKIARENGLQSSTVPDDNELCAVCLEQTCTVAAKGCGHELCTKCALCLCITSNTKSETEAPPGSIPCPLCRTGISSFVRLPTFTMEELKQDSDTSLCEKCKLHAKRLYPIATKTDFCKALVCREATNFISSSRTTTSIASCICEKQCDDRTG